MPKQARIKLSMHAGKTENFSDGYVYALKYSFYNIEQLQQKFDEIFICLKELREEFYAGCVEKELLADLNTILLQSILYSNSKADNCEIAGIFAEVLSETLCYLLENAENPFESFDNYKENYDDKLYGIKTNPI